MKLLPIIAKLFTASATAKCTLGQDCRTNKGCDENCVGGKWSVVIEAGDTRMVCDPSTLDSTRYVTAACLGENGSDKFAKNGKSVCDIMAGVFCSGYCSLKTSASKGEDLTTRFQELCTKKKTRMDMYMMPLSIYIPQRNRP
ncbi:uncharacterized protein N7503_004616 [Penicillium pulvis]|uniref:uncharacterized protein n=1 Tax=Penicillium pulvis TaxID=1562058 RepID=UPI002548806A|nr:uncharacterized protein N7503_004616 [Penicillium pulvis]KAJ5802166.1 hypothetical protein N7503_004616 [Penicillium pulvis]